MKGRKYRWSKYPGQHTKRYTGSVSRYSKNRPTKEEMARHLEEALVLLEKKYGVDREELNRMISVAGAKLMGPGRARQDEFLKEKELQEETKSETKPFDVEEFKKFVESAYVPRRVEKPWGWEIIWAKTDKYVGKILHIEAGKRLSLQYHEKKDETIRVLSGNLELLTINEGVRAIRSMGEGDGHHIIPGLQHRMSATTTCEVLEVSTPELDDVIRIEDDYNRT